jgi:two-component system, sensor histidine kinase and response regulator
MAAGGVSWVKPRMNSADFTVVSDPHFDPSRLAMFRELREPGQPDPVIELIEIFVSQGHELLGRAQSALAEKNFRVARHAIHSLKGSAGNVGAKRLAVLAAEVEDSLDQGNEQMSPAALDDVRGEFSHVTTLLERHKQAA